MKIDEKVIAAYQKANPEDVFCLNLPDIIKAYEAAKATATEESPASTTATNAFCKYNPAGYNWSSKALEAACKAYHKAAIPEQPVDTSDIAHKLEYAFPQISLSALSDIIGYFRPYLRQPEREAVTLSIQQAENMLWVLKSVEPSRTLRFHAADQVPYALGESVEYLEKALAEQSRLGSDNG